MSEIIIKSLTEKTIPILQTQYRGIKYNPLVSGAFKKRKVEVLFIDGDLIFRSKKNKVEKSNIPMIEGYLKSRSLKKNIDYKIEVKK